MVREGASGWRGRRRWRRRQHRGGRNAGTTGTIGATSGGLLSPRCSGIAAAGIGRCGTPKQVFEKGSGTTVMKLWRPKSLKLYLTFHQKRDEDKV